MIYQMHDNKFKTQPFQLLWIIVVSILNLRINIFELVNKYKAMDQHAYITEKHSENKPTEYIIPIAKAYSSSIGGIFMYAHSYVSINRT